MVLTGPSMLVRPTQTVKSTHQPALEKDPSVQGSDAITQMKRSQEVTTSLIEPDH